MTPKDLARKLRSAAVQNAVPRTMGRAAAVGEARAKANASGRPGGLRRRSGALLSTIAGRVERAGNTYDLIWQAGGGPRGVRYARIHEEGGTIRPTRSKMLAIPLRGNKHREGGPRSQPGLRVLRARDGRVYLVDERGKPQWILKRYVVIPARPYLRPARDEVARVLPDLLRANVLRALGEGA